MTTPCDRVQQTVTDIAPEPWVQRAFAALLDLASLDFDEGTPEDILEPVVELLVQPPFEYEGAAVYHADGDGWSRCASAGAIAQPRLPVEDGSFDFSRVGPDLRLKLDGGGGARVLVLRRGEKHESAAEEPVVLRRLVGLVDNLLDQYTYTNLLANSEYFYRSLYSRANLGIFFSRVGGGLQRANPGLLGLLGYATEREMRETVGPRLDTNFYDPPDDRQRMVEAILSDGQVHDFQTRIRRADGSLVPVSMTSCLVLDSDYQMQDPEFFGFVTDLSDQDSTAEARRDLRRAKAANLNKIRFLASMSHELRTPLNGVVGMADLLATGDLDSDQAEAVKLIHGSADQLLALVDRISDYTTLEFGAMALSNEPFSPTELVDGVRCRWHDAAQSQRLDLQLRKAPDLPATVCGDARRCAQILDLLVDNAIKYTPSGGRVEIQAASRDEAMLLSVSDTGVGIDSDQLEAILGGDAQSNDHAGLGGTGLGLAMVQRLVELMDGRLWVDSTVDCGSRFSVLLPLPRPDVKVEAEPKIVDDTGRLRILVVEDNAVNQLVARKLLESLDLDVTLVPGGREAVAEVVQRSYDLVFMDLQMPEMDGFAATLALRSEAEYQGPVVAMTAHATEYHRDKCRRTGMNGFVTKPLERKRLADFLESLPPQDATPGPWLWIEPDDNRPLASGPVGD